MSAVYSCDGCSQEIEGTPIHVGHILVRDYCPVCAPKAQQFQSDEEALRKSCYEMFQDGRALLIASAGDFMLPDVPHG